ncbi:MAG: PBP1A family penicillin-binding protein [Verrucomicrobiota bacterium]
MILLKTGFFLALFIGLGVLALYLDYHSRAMEFDLSDVGKIPERSAVFDINGRLMARIQGENRVLIPLSAVPRDFIDALLAREDSRFWQHGGLDYVGIARACVANWRGSAVRQGGSTITQQLARNSFGLTARTVDRKLLEIMLARRIEASFTKRQILEFYINRVYLGAGAYGLERGAQVYFGKSAQALDLAECTLLAGIIRSPNRMSPLSNRQGALEQRDAVLKRMLTLGMISPERARLARREEMRIVEHRRQPIRHSYALDLVLRDLQLILTQNQIDQGGLRIYTTLDPALQRSAEKAVTQRTAELEAQPTWKHPRKAEFISGLGEWPPKLEFTLAGCAPEPTWEMGNMGGMGSMGYISPIGPISHIPLFEKPTPYLQAALIAIDNRTGAVRALVGGRDYSESKFDRATQARRQIGSTFKPFVYATAFQRGLFPGARISDGRIRPGEYGDLPKNWSPENSDGEYGGFRPVSYGLVNSRNTMSVRVGESAGLQSVRQVANRAGLGPDVPPYPVVFLGGFETTLKDLATAYTAFPNRGVRLQSYVISRIENSKGTIIFQASHARVPVLSRGAAWLTSRLLEQVLRIGTGAKAAKLGLSKPAAGKTGTTNDFHDAWFVGYTSSLTCGVWVGFDRPQNIMDKGYGATLALPIWVDFIQSAPDAYPARDLSSPEKIVQVRVCAESNAIATAGCNRAQTSYPIEVPEGFQPKVRCTLHDDLIPIQAAIPLSPPQPGTVLTATALAEPSLQGQSPRQASAPVYVGKPTRVLTRAGMQQRGSLGSGHD